MSAPFRDRRDAGRALAGRLRSEPFVAPIVLALPRGGVPVGYEVAIGLDASLDVFVARKVGAPGREELGVGAVVEGTDELFVSDVAAALGLSSRRLEALAAIARTELRRRVERYRGAGSLPTLVGRDVIVVDDGVATGITAEASLRALRRCSPRRLVLAEPVCAPAAARRLALLADRVVCLETPTDLEAVGYSYDDFSPTGDAEVIDLLRRANARPRTESSAPPS